MNDEVQPFFAFPLEFLAYGTNEKERLHAFIAWSSIELAAKLQETVDYSELQEEVSCVFEDDLPIDYAESPRAAAFVTARQRLHIVRGSISDCNSTHRKLTEFHDEHNAAYGESPTVRLSVHYVWDTINGSMAYRELAVLAALYSVIGAKRYPVRVTRDAIRRRMLGYKTQAVMTAELPKRIDDVQPLSVWQIGRILDELHKRRFFSRARANARQTYYSLTLNQEQLEKRLLESKTYAADFHKRRIERNSKLMARIAAARA